MSTGVLEAVPTSQDGERVVEPKPMNEVAARRITERIRNAINGVWAMMLEAYEKQAHVALGYERWEDYVKAEFQMSRGESYRLIDQGRVIKALSSAVGTSRARDIATQVSGRQAAVLKQDIDVAAAEVTKAIDAGMETREAIREAVARRSIAPAPPMAALPPARPATVRRGELFDDEDVLSAASDLRERLRDCFGAVRSYVGRAPKRDGVDQDTLRDELRQWLVAISLIVSQDHLDGLYMLRAELYDWLKSLGDERAAIAQLAGVSAAAVDYSVSQLHSVAADGKRKKRA